MDIIDDKIEEAKEEDNDVNKIEETEEVNKDLKEDNKIEEVKEEQEEIKPKKKLGQPPKPITKRQLLKEKVVCNKCNKTISKHCMLYSHSEKCIVNKVNKIQKEKPIKVEQPKIEPPKPPSITQREIINRVEQFNNAIKEETIINAPLDEKEIIFNYFHKIKQQEKEKKQNQIKQLFNSVLRRNKN